MAGEFSGSCSAIDKKFIGGLRGASIESANSGTVKGKFEHANLF
jgi:hypothetical protein